MNPIQHTLSASSPLPSDGLSHTAHLGGEALEHVTLSKIEQVYQVNINASRPVEVASFPEIPSLLNLLTTLPDLYCRSRNFIDAVRHKDSEGSKDTALSLAVLPVSFTSSIVIALDYASIFGWLPHFISTILRPFYAVGMVMCFVEGAIEGISLSRSVRFSHSFEFKLVKSLRTLIGENSSAKKLQAIRSARSSIKNRRKQMEKIYGEDQVTFFSNCFSSLEKDMNIEERQGEIKEIARMVLSHNLSYLQEKYLGLSKKEVREIETQVNQKHSGTSPDVLTAALKRAFEKRVVNKYKKLARRIQPYLTCEAIAKTTIFLDALKSAFPEELDQGIKGGFDLINDMHIQNKKKALVHVMGIISLFFAAAFCIACIIGAPYIALIILFSLTLITGIGRALLFSGSLNVRGWHFSGKELLPHCIRRKIFPNAPSLGDPEKLKAQINIYCSKTVPNTK